MHLVGYLLASLIIHAALFLSANSSPVRSAGFIGMAVQLAKDFEARGSFPGDTKLQREVTVRFDHNNTLPETLPLPHRPHPEKALSAVGDAAHLNDDIRPQTTSNDRASGYFRLSELDERPLALNHPDPAYPPEITNAISGSVIIQLLINGSGSVDHIEATPSELPPAFVDSAINAFLTMRFKPAILNGHPVKSQIWIEVSFEPVTAPELTVNINSAIPSAKGS